MPRSVMTAADISTPALERSPWVIGDLQGCLDPLLALVNQLPVTAPIWLTGDLINRGPRSLDTLRWVIAQGDRVRAILGNHDLHLLAIALGVRKPHRNDTYDDILNAPDREDLIDWLRAQPLAHHEQGWLMVHAGVLPQWTVTKRSRSQKRCPPCSVVPIGRSSSQRCMAMSLRNGATPSRARTA